MHCCPWIAHSCVVGDRGGCVALRCDRTPSAAHTASVSADSAPRPFPPPPPGRLALRVLAWLGWRLELPPLEAARMVLVVYPHTSNWDFPLGLLVRFGTGWPISWVGKHSIFAGPWGGLMKRWGGIPVDRRAAEDFVGQMVAEFGRRERMILAIAPEGTRGHVTALKSGFYRIAREAQVPIAFGYIDYASRSLGIAGLMTPSGRQEEDLAVMRAAYAGKRGYHHECAGEIRFRDRGPH